MSTTKQICYLFYEDCGDAQFTCKLCDSERKQAPSSGYFNLISYLSNKHSDYREVYEREQRNGVRQMEDLGFVHERTSHLYQLIRWVVERNLPLCEADHPLTRAMSKLTPTNSQALKVSMDVVAQKIGSDLTNELGSCFALMLDRWTCGSVHYVAVFAAYATGDSVRKPLLAISPLDNGSQSAEAHHELLMNVLAVYEETTQMICCIIGDNCNTNKALATTMDVPLIDCASHRLNLSVQRFLVTHGQLVDQVNALIVQLRRPNLSGELARHTDLRPIKRNVIRWSSTYDILAQYVEIRSDIRMIEDVEDAVPNSHDHKCIVKLIEHFKIFDSVCKRLQSESLKMANVRLLFNSLVQKYPSTVDHLGVEARVIHSPAFKNGLVKLLNGAQNTQVESKAIRSLKTTDPACGEKRKERDDFASTVLREGAPQRRSGRAAAGYSKLAQTMPPTSNDCERLFCQCKLILTQQRNALLPTNFEMLTFLRVNREMWNATSLIETAVGE